MISSSSKAVRTFAAYFAGAALTLSALACSGGGAADASGAKHPLIGVAAPEIGSEATWAIRCSSAPFATPFSSS